MPLVPEEVGQCGVAWTLVEPWWSLDRYIWRRCAGFCGHFGPCLHCYGLCDDLLVGLLIELHEGSSVLVDAVDGVLLEEFVHGGFGDHMLFEELDELIDGTTWMSAFDCQRCWSEPVYHFGFVERVNSMSLGFTLVECLEDVDLVCTAAQLEWCAADVENLQCGLHADGFLDHQVGEVRYGDVVHDLDVLSLCCLNCSLELFLFSVPGSRWLRFVLVMFMASGPISESVGRISFQR